MSEQNGSTIDFVVVGAQKTGSSTLSKYLAKLPGLFMPRYEQVIFESPYFENDAVRRFLVSNSSKSQGNLLGIKRPDYLMSDVVPARLYDHNKDIKIVVVTRDRFSRMKSAIYWYMQIGKMPIAAAESHMQRMIRSSDDQLSQAESEILEYGNYSIGISRYIEQFGDKAVLVISNALIREDPVRALQCVYEHLDLSWPQSGVDVDTAVNKKAGVYDSRRLKYLSWINRKLFYLENGDGKQTMDIRSPLHRAIYYGLLAIDRLLLSKLFNQPDREITPDVKSQVNNYYEEERRKYQGLVSKYPSVFVSQ